MIEESATTDSIAGAHPAGSGELLRYMRVSAGYTQQELAARCGLARQTVSALEQGHYSPRRCTRAALAAVLGCEVGSEVGAEVGGEAAGQQ